MDKQKITDEMIIREHIENCFDKNCPIAKRYNAYIMCGQWIIEGVSQ